MMVYPPLRRPAPPPAIQTKHFKRGARIVRERGGGGPYQTATSTRPKPRKTNPQGTSWVLE